jgi:hypothetical protein
LDTWLRRNQQTPYFALDFVVAPLPYPSLDQPPLMVEEVFCRPRIVVKRAPDRKVVVNGDDFAVRRQWICYCRIPVVERAGEMLQKQQRSRRRLPEAAVRVRRTTRINEVGRRGGVARDHYQ